MSSQAHSHAAWMQAQHFFMRDARLLNVEEKDLLDDWEVVLCDLSALDVEEFRVRMERCLGRSHSFLMQHTETIKQLGAESLQGVLRSRDLKHDPMVVFILLLLERYSESLTERQRGSILLWEAELCQISAEAEQEATRTRSQAVVRLQNSSRNLQMKSCSFKN